jgi:putative PEP-CTERM system TPR-repeat lipoprotein
MRPGFATVASACVTALLLTGCSSDAAKQRHFANGTRYLEEGRPADAVIELRGAVEGDELWGEARYKLAEAYDANGEAENAFREYIRAADLLPENTEAQLKAATYLLLVGQYEDARTRVQRVVEREPANVEAQIILGNALAGLKDLEGAVAQINEAIALEPGRSESYTNLAIVRVEQGEREQAQQAFQKAVEADPKSVAALLALANFQWSVGQSAAAEQSLRRAYDIDAANILTNRALAAFYIAAGRPADAEQHLVFAATHTDGVTQALALADYYIAQSRPDDARRVLQPLTTRAGAAAAAEIRLATLIYDEGRTGEAHTALDALIAREPGNGPALLLKARWLLAEGRLEPALARARAAVTAAPRLAMAHYVRGLAEAASHRPSEAIKSFSEVLRLNSRATIAQVQLSRLHLSRNSVDSAVIFAEQALRNAPDSLDARLALVRAWIARDDFSLAESELAALKRQAPAVAAVHALDGSLAMIRGNHAAARSAFDRALQLDASSVEALTGLTTLDMVQGRVAAARARVEAVMNAGVENADVLFLAGKVFVAAGDSEPAARVLRRNIELDPLNLDTYALLARVYADRGALDSARAEFDRLVEQEPRNIAARQMAALIAHVQGNLEAAESRYLEILKIEPRAALAGNNLAAIYAERGENLDLAQRLAETAADQFPMHPEVQDTLGFIYYQRHALAPAIRRFERSIAADPRNAMYHYHLGLAYTKNGEPDRARRALEQALALNPQLTDARQALASLQE